MPWVARIEIRHVASGRVSSERWWLAVKMRENIVPYSRRLVAVFILSISLLVLPVSTGYAGSEDAQESKWRGEGFSSDPRALMLLELVDEEGEFIDLRNGEIIDGVRLRGAGGDAAVALFPDRNVYEIVFGYMKHDSAADVCSGNGSSSHTSEGREYSVTVESERSGAVRYSSVSVFVETFVDSGFGISESLYVYRISCEKKPYKLVGSFSVG